MSTLLWCSIKQQWTLNSLRIIVSNTSRWFVWTKTGLTGCHLAFLCLHQSAASRVFSSHCKAFTQLCQFSVKGFLFSDNNRSYWPATVWWLCILNINSNSKSRKQFQWFLNHKENINAHYEQTIWYSKLWRSLHVWSSFWFWLWCCHAGFSLRNHFLVSSSVFHFF